MYIIAGIDPGKTCGIACLDLNGRLVITDHRLFGGSGWIVETLNRIGTPVIIASDKPTSSSAVKKINAFFNAKLFTPDREFKVEEKREAAKDNGIKDPHERDAYVAAIAAYRSYANKFKQIEHLAKSNSAVDLEKVKAKVVAKYSISEAINNRKANR
jgi:uncharacterized protein